MKISGLPGPFTCSEYAGFRRTLLTELSFCPHYLFPMKTLLTHWLLPVLSFLLLAPAAASAQATPSTDAKVKVKVKGKPGEAEKTKVKIPITTIYIVRHAEKDSLTDQGRRPRALGRGPGARRRP